MRGISQHIAIEEEQDRTNGLGLTCSIVASMRLNAALSPSARRSPSGVGSTERAPRVRSAIPSAASRDLICRLTAPCVTQSSSAASVMLQRRAVASKARNAFSDGTTDVIVAVLTVDRIQKSPTLSVRL